MSLTLELPDTLEAALLDRATRAGVSLSEYAVAVLSKEGLSRVKAASGKDVMALWKKAGVVGSRAEIKDSASHARKVRRAAETRERREQKV